MPFAAAVSLLGVPALLAWPDLPQPDWPLAVLGGLVLASPASWRWAAPLLGLHDLVLWGAPWHLWWAFGAGIWLPWLDVRIGPGVPQRALWALAALVVPALAGWSFASLLLTALLLVISWRLWGERLGVA